MGASSERTARVRAGTTSGNADPGRAQWPTGESGTLCAMPTTSEPASTPPSPGRPTPEPATRRARMAVAGMFAVNAMVYASIVPWLPEIKADLGLSNTALGTAIAIGPVAGILFGTAVGSLIGRWGSARATVIGALVQLAAVPVVAAAPSWGVLAAGILVVGGTDTLTDAAMNAHGLRVQRRYGRTIIASFHAVWSSGAVAAGLIGAAAVGVGVPRVVHLGAMTALLVVATVVGRRWLLPGADHAERPEEAAMAAARDTATGPDADGTRRPATAGIRHALRVAPMMLLGLGLLLTAAGMVEDTAATWAALHLRESVGATAFVAGLGFVFAQSGMVLGRATGDRVVDHFGARTVATAGTLLAAVSMLVAALASVPWIVVLAFGCAGVGVATLFPLGLSAAGEVPGVRSGDGIAIVSLVARTGFLVGPPLIGVVADAISLRVALLVVVVAALVGTASSRLLPRGPAKTSESTA